MGLDRRVFFKLLGVTGLTLAIGKESVATPKGKDEVEFFGILYDSTRCVGCRTCEYECAAAHGLPEPSSEIEAVRKTDETCNTVVNTFQTEKGEVYVKRQCMHCNEPACDAACLTQAMHKNKTGPVTWDGDKCMGCRYCMISCPFDMPKFEFHSSNPKIQKCDMCFDRQKTGEMPVCVTNCPNEALFYGKRRDLIKEARRRIYEQPELYVDYIYGEHDAGGTGWLYLSPVPFEELGMNTTLQNSSYPALTKGFLYSVPSVDLLLPPLLLGIYAATKNKQPKEEENE
ncbi:MAG TPA: 4Fe-4S dicluster domain-containing protein [Prolixibacteraceae bacterium]|nr:4Fe-4S dicluster domain-containing protein [Prolixibacteraceae bacterium]